MSKVQEEAAARAEAVGNGAQARQRRKLLLSTLPRLLETVKVIFATTGRAVIGHKELVTAQLTAARCTVTDRDATEAQLGLLTEIAPKCLSRKTSVSGDVLYRLQWDFSVSGLRKRLSRGTTTGKRQRDARTSG